MNERKVRVPTLAAVRWGAREERSVSGGSAVQVAQFLDLQLLAPQQLAIALYALTAAPIAGISVQWTIQLGAGSFSHIEQTTLAVSDILSQVPLVIFRPANSVQLSALITRLGAGAPKQVKLVAFIAPLSPTWKTDITCTVET
jgi:hypothetical protein